MIHNNIVYSTQQFLLIIIRFLDVFDKKRRHKSQRISVLLLGNITEVGIPNISSNLTRTTPNKKADSIAPNPSIKKSFFGFYI